jgi:hypothetical protein
LRVLALTTGCNMGGKGGLAEYTRRYFEAKPTKAEKRKLFADIEALIDNASGKLSVVVLVEPDQEVKKRVTGPKKRGPTKKT